MQVFGADFAYLMCWTPHGASLFYCERNDTYWREVCRAACASHAAAAPPLLMTCGTICNACRMPALALRPRCIALCLVESR